MDPVLLSCASPILLNNLLIVSETRVDRYLNTLYSVTAILQQATSLDEAAPRLLCSVCTHLDWLLGEIWQVDVADEQLRWVSAWHDPGLPADRFISASRRLTRASGAGLSGCVWVSLCKLFGVRLCALFGAVDRLRNPSAVSRQ